MNRFATGLLGVACAVSLISPSTLRAADKPPAPPIDPAPWVSVSDATVQKLKDEGKKFGFAGETAGVAVDAATGDVYMIVNGQGIWKSTDAGATFEHLRRAGILVKNMHGSHPALAQCLRITVGSPEDNDRVLAALGPRP